MDPETRHTRTEQVRGIGRPGRQRISSAAVLVIGAGGLGSPVLQYLAASGVGRIGIVDPDVVAPSNLARQVVHPASSVGERKTSSAARAIRALDPTIDVVEHPMALTRDNALDLVAGWDAVVDATDDPESRYLVSDAAALAGIPDVWGAVLGMEGQVSVFGEGPDGPIDYRDLHPVPPVGEVESCATAGVLGPVCGVVGSAMAVEALKVVGVFGEPLYGRVLHYDGASGSWRGIPLRRRADRVPVAAVGEGIPERAPEIPWGDRGARVVVDVREPAERAERHLPDDLALPLHDLLADPEGVGRRPVLVYCASGVRSATAALALRAVGVDAVSLRGGIASVD